MKGSLILALGLSMVTSGIFAQKSQTYHPKKAPHAVERKPAKIAPMTKAPGASADTGKDLRRIEQQSAKTPATMKTPAAKKPAASDGLLKQKPAPPIKATGGGAMGTNTKGFSGANQGTNPYRGRLRQKGNKQ